jgi:carbamoyl-phosphate synthase large subunit
MDVTIGLTCVGAPAWSCVIQQLRNSPFMKLRIIGMDMHENHAGQEWVDRFYLVPAGNSEGYAEKVLGICVKEKIEILIPGADEEVFAISERQDLFEERKIICTVPPRNKLDLFSNKFAMYDFLRKNGIDVPWFFLIRDASDIRMVADSMQSNEDRFVMKRCQARGGRGVFLVNRAINSPRDITGLHKLLEIDLATMASIVGEYPGKSFMAMEYLEGTFFSVDALCERGDPIYLIPRERVNPRGIPWLGSKIVNNERLLDVCKRMCRLLSLHYLFDFDMAEVRNRIYPMEVNPRPSGSVCATIGAGINLFDDLIRLCLSLPIEKRGIPFGTSVYPRIEPFLMNS